MYYEIYHLQFQINAMVWPFLCHCVSFLLAKKLISTRGKLWILLLIFQWIVLRLSRRLRGHVGIIHLSKIQNCIYFSCKIMQKCLNLGGQTFPPPFTTCMPMVEFHCMSTGYIHVRIRQSTCNHSIEYIFKKIFYCYLGGTMGQTIFQKTLDCFACIHY